VADLAVDQVSDPARGGAAQVAEEQAAGYVGHVKPLLVVRTIVGGRATLEAN